MRWKAPFETGVTHGDLVSYYGLWEAVAVYRHASRAVPFLDSVPVWLPDTVCVENG